MPDGQNLDDSRLLGKSFYHIREDRESEMILKLPIAVKHQIVVRNRSPQAPKDPADLSYVNWKGLRVRTTK